MPDRAERRRAARAGSHVDPKLVAAVDLVARTGAADAQIRYSDDEQPVVWFAVARFHTGPDGRPHRGTGEPDRWETAAGRDPTEAVLRLCERLVDGGRCQHCKRPAMFHADLDTNPTPLDPLFCSYEGSDR